MKIFNIQAGQSFAHIFCENILQKYTHNTLDITDLTIWVPSSRIATTIKNTFYEINGETLLPQIKPFNLGEEAEEEILFHTDGSKQETISLIEKKLVLTRQIHAKDIDKPLSYAMKGAEELLKLHSRMLTWGVTVADIQDIIPDDLAEHWQQNLLFLNIVFEFYPQWLALENKVDPVAWRQNLLYETAGSLATQKKPIIAAGFTDTTPAGLAMLKAVLQHENGQLFFPGVDTDMSEEDWQKIPQSHPQHSIKNLLEQLDIKRDDIQTLGDEIPTVEATGWRHIMSHVPVQNEDPVLENISIVEAESETQEAEVIAHIMRETLEHKNKTCTLVTAESSLAARVESFLQRWNIQVDNSAGKPLTQTSIGQFFCDILGVVSQQFTPLSIASVLHNSNFYTEEGLPLKGFEEAVLRGIKPIKGLHGLRQKLSGIEVGFGISEEDIANAGKWIDTLEQSWQPLNFSTKQSFEKWLKAHFEVLQNISKFELWARRDDGNALNQFLASWQNQGEVVGDIPFNEYAQIVKHLLHQVTVRKKSNTHPRLFICGALEARLKKHDRLIIANANEGTWPRQYKPDPWLNPAIEEAVGLPSAEVEVGLGAQDFCTLACSEEVFITRAIKTGGEETVATRFLTRFFVRNNKAYITALQKGQQWLSILRQTHAQGNYGRDIAVEAEPLPPITERPSKWSASFTKNMMQCPYKAYIEKILKIHKVDEYEEDPSPADKGDLFHHCLEAFFVGDTAFSESVNDKTKVKALNHLVEISDEFFKKKLKSSPTAYAIWWPRFKLVAEEFIQQLVAQNTTGRTPSQYEKFGNITLANGMVLRATADRIDTTAEGAVLVDYKTGKPPSVKDVLSGIEPQMAVEAVILSEGGYGKSDFAGAEFWQLTSSGKRALNITGAFGNKADKAEQWIADAKTGLENITTHFQKPESSYKILPSGSKYHKEKHCTYCDYDGICRFKERVT
jgi:ATP-dependent helicase/nuclease subunit B